MRALRYVIVGKRRDNAHPFNYYVSVSGFTTQNHANAAVLHTLTEAKAERDYHNRTSPAYVFHIEQLPPRVSVANGILRSTVVD